MADSGAVKAYLAGLESDVKTVLGSVFDYVLKELRFGRAEASEAATNFGGGFFKGTTDAVANTEFSIVHNFGRTPYLLIPVMPGNIVGAKIVRLENSRAWDANRIYLKSPDVDAVFYLYLEG